MREEKKVNAGAQFFQTNLVYDVEGFERWLAALDKRGVIGRVFRIRPTSSSASWGLRPGRNPCEQSRKSCSQIAFSKSAAAFCTILSSNEGIEIGRCRPSSFGI